MCNARKDKMCCENGITCNACLDDCKHAKEIMETKRFTIEVCRWFDKVNGNTYHSVRCTRHSDGAVIVHAWTYGYDRAYESTALKTMLEAGWLPKRCTENNVYLYERETDYPIIWMVSDGLKRDMVANGQN